MGIRAVFKVGENADFYVFFITNMDGVVNSSELLKAEGCAARALGLSIFSITFLGVLKCAKLQRYRVNNCADIPDDGGSYCLASDALNMELRIEELEGRLWSNGLG